MTVHIKVPFVGNLKNEIVNFYDKLGFKKNISFNFVKKSLVFALLESNFPSEYRDVKLLKFEKWLAKVSAVGLYNPDCILVIWSKIFGGIIPTHL